MADIKQQIKLNINKSLRSALDADVLIRSAKAAGDEAVNQMIKRTQKGIDTEGRRFGKYNRDYNKKRALKYAAKKYGRTKYASSKDSDKLQLTGNLFSALSYKVKSIRNVADKIQITIELYIKGRRENLKAEGLMSRTGTARNGKRYSKKEWKFFGLSESGTNLNNERKAIQKAMLKVLQEKLRIIAKAA